MRLFSSLRFGDVVLKNRIAVSPMCEYSARDGHPQDWHMVHLGSRAVGGAALVFTEATAVQELGRISPADTGIYLDEHVESWRPIAKFVREQGAVPAMKLAHAGRKGSTTAPWQGGKALGASDGAWTTAAPSAIRFDEGYDLPRSLTLGGMITEPEQAEAIIEKGQADLVLLAREMLRDPYWPRRAAKLLGVTINPPVQYQRAW